MNELETKIINMMEKFDTKWDMRWQTVQDQITALKVEVARLAATVETHEKRSTNLEAKQEDCQEVCQKQIATAQEVANNALEVAQDFKRGVKVFLWIFGALATALTIVASVVQVLDYFKKP